MQKTHHPLVSIIIPSFNSALHVSQAVESALNQSYKNCEIIVVDDGSTDNTKDVLNTYIEKGQIKYIYQENRGLAGARNTGLKVASGKYINLLDADDLLHKNKVEKNVHFLEEHPECGVVYTDIRFFHNNDIDHLFDRQYSFFEEDIFENIILKVFIFPHAAFFRVEIINKIGLFDESLKRCEDSDFWIRASLAGIKFRFFNEPMAFYRLHEGQMTQNKLDIWKTFIQVIQRYEKHNPRIVRKAVATHELNIAEYLLRHGQETEGRQYLLRAIKNRPDRFWKGIRIVVFSYFMDGHRALERAGFNIPYTLKNLG